jgi:hypothetical protein
LELSGPMRQDAGPARPMIDTQGLAGPVACRSGSALKRRVRRRAADEAKQAPGDEGGGDGCRVRGEGARISPPDCSRTYRQTGESMIHGREQKLVAVARLRAVLTEKTTKSERHDWYLADA